MDPAVQVQVVDELGNVIGTGTIDYIDESASGQQRTIVTRTIQLRVVDEAGNELGSGTIEYDDYVSYMFGGTRTITVSGYVYSEAGDEVGTFKINLTDTYGAESAVGLEQSIHLLVQLLAILVVIMILQIIIRIAVGM